MSKFVATEKPRLRPCGMISLGFAAISAKGWECIGEFNGDVVTTRGLTPSAAFKTYQEQCKKRRPLLTKLADWIKGTS